MKSSSAGAISFYDSKDPDSSVYNYTLQMDAGRFGFYFSTVNSCYNLGIVKASIDCAGNYIGLGNITAYGTPSDIKLKENIVKIPNSLEKVNTLNGYTYNYIGKTDRLMGVIAQEVEKVAPELVYEFEDIETKETSKAVRYEHITALLIESVKELTAQVNELKAEIEELKKR
jgi:hypothetical protein